MAASHAGLEPPGPVDPTRSEPSPRATPSAVRGWAIALGWVAAATVLQLVRAPGPPVWRAIWAEDGHVFLTDALAHPLGSLVKPHAGYVQLMARIVGTTAAVFPLDDAAVTFAVTGSLVVSVLSVYVFFSSRSILGSGWARALLAASFVFASVTALEAEANGLDLHWYLLFACFLALWSTSDSTPELVADAVVVGLATLSGPLTLLYAPLLVRRVRAGTGRRRWIVPAVYGAAVAAQALTAANAVSGSQRYSSFRLINVPIAYGLRVAGSVLVGDRYLRSAWLSLGLWFCALSLVLVGAVCLYAVSRARGTKLALILVALAYSGVIFTVSVYLRGTGEMRPPVDSFTLNGSRYTVVPALLLITVLIVIADQPPTFGPTWVLRGLAAFVALVSLLSWRSVPNVRIYAPDWRKSLHAARQQCGQGGTRSVHVPVAPGPPEAWYVVVRCDPGRPSATASRK